MRADDAEWAAGLLELKRREYARYSPLFSRPAEGASTLHARFLRRQILSEATVALRTRDGFIICERRPAEGFHDFTLTPLRRWDDDGAALLLAAAERLAADGIGTLRVVTAHEDQPKSALLRALSLSVAEQWWVHELLPAGAPAPPGRVNGPGFSGLLARRLDLSPPAARCSRRTGWNTPRDQRNHARGDRARRRVRRHPGRPEYRPRRRTAAQGMGYRLRLVHRPPPAP